MLHIGENVKFFRKLRSFHQKEVAAGLHITQQAYEKIEKKEIVDDETLQKIASILEFPVEVFKAEDLPTKVNNIFQTYGNYGTIWNNGSGDLDALVKVYERLIQSKDDEIETLKKLIKKLED